MKVMKTQKSAALRILSVAIAFMLVFALSACAGEEAAKPDLTIGVSGTISSLDVNQEAGILNYQLAALTQEGLVSMGNDGEIVPSLAESWTDEDATVWKFKLREGAKFHDGTDVTADDVVYSIERAMDPEQSPGVSIYFPDYVDTVEKTADDEITVTLDGSHAGFIWAVSNTGGLLVTPKAWSEEAGAIGSPTDLIVGSGPYKVVDFEPSSHVTYEAVDTWWGGAPALTSLRVDFFGDEETRLLAFTQGDIDFALSIPVENADNWEKVEGATIEYYPERSYYGLTFDPTVEPFDDIHVRKAVALAVDKESIVSGSILEGHSEVASAITPPEQFVAVLSADEAKEQLDTITQYNYDIDAARAELAQSKVPDGFTTTIYYPDAYKNAGEASLAIADTLLEIGIKLEVKEIPLEQWLNEVGDGNQGIAWMIYLATTAEPGEIVAWLCDAQGSGINPANWTNEAAAEQVRLILSAESLEAQVPPTIESNEIAEQEAVYQPLWWGEAAIAWQEGVTVKDFTSFSLLSPDWPKLFT
ncbi:MAG: ABC transporter substrate-binding protein [Clostridiales Family XIII bacterium]|nr:ABC transporter substrate-binding protein [Clostridiales Family XIII bacterium]